MLCIGAHRVHVYVWYFYANRASSVRVCRLVGAGTHWQMGHREAFYICWRICIVTAIAARMSCLLSCGILTLLYFLPKSFPLLWWIYTTLTLCKVIAVYFIIKLRFSFSIHIQCVYSVHSTKHRESWPSLSVLLPHFLSLCYSSACWSLWVWGECLQPPPVPHRQEAQSNRRCVRQCSNSFCWSQWWRTNQMEYLLAFLSLHAKKHWT